MGLEQLQEGSRDRPDALGCCLRPTRLPHPPAAGITRAPGREIPLGDISSLWDRDIRACRKRGMWAESEHHGETKTPLSAATAAASSLGYSLSLHLAENSRRSHSEMSLCDSARIPRGKSLLHRRASALPRRRVPFGRQRRAAAILPQQRSSPKEI